MNPRFLLSEMLFSCANGVGARSRARLCFDCISARRHSVWNHRRGRPHRVGLRIKGKPYSVWLRNNGSDIRILTTLLKDGEYDAPGLDWGDVKTVVDAGANIGISSLFIHANAPTARIIAVEPEPANADVLRRNLADNHLPAVAFEAALWHSRGTIQLQVKDSAMSHAIPRSDERHDAEVREVRAVDMEELIDALGVEEVDLVKLDIEGAEREVLTVGGDWIPRVKHFLAECHPTFGLSSDQLGTILEERGFDVVKYNVQHDLVFASRR
jgi:FkbM family methyltransferase